MGDCSVRSLNLVPITKVKKKRPSEEEDEDTVSCKLCFKNFTNEVALTNHARMEHFDVYVNGDPSLWTERLPPNKPLRDKEEEKKVIRERTKELIANMVPTSLSTLASKDVSYIIVESEDGPQPAKKKKTGKIPKEKREKEKTIKMIAPKKDKELQPITGPFECLQPSSLVAAGTCHQIFFSCCEYSAHHRDEHTRRRKGLRCQVCEKPLNADTEAQSLFFCDSCGAGFQSGKELAEHGATAHVKLKPYECSTCRKRFTQQGGLQQHTRMHTGYRPFTCTVCSKSFTQKSGLDQHFRIHTKVRPYRCVICGKTFCQSIHLKQHMRTHTNVSPFQCGICDKRFKQSSHLNYHLKYHNPATMTDEQKRKYVELVGLIAKKDAMEVTVECEPVLDALTEPHERVETECVLNECGTDGGAAWCVSLP